jgi:hypothetical protein
MVEAKRKNAIPPHQFVQHLAWSFLFSAGIAATALTVGILGFHFIADVAWIDALHNAAMILGGMGPVVEMKTDAAKLFSSAYALFSGLVFISVVAVTLMPVLHRVLHKFHVDEADLKKK